MKTTLIHLLWPALAAGSGFLFARSLDADDSAPAGGVKAIAARGEYLVRLGGCADCHTPKILTDHGPADDPSRRFSGHPADRRIAAPQLEPGGIWSASTAGMTAWTGKWGVTFAANLTPDHATGMGDWTRDEFARAMRTGKHKGEGRAILPPMPWQPLAEATEEDLTAIFTYLRSLPAVSNRVPEPLPPGS